jgi:putative ABC transport system permease protein
MILLAAFASLALVLALVGIYSLVAYSVTQRTGEIGVRLALGATPRDVLTLILGQGMRPVLLGLAVGLAAALALTRLIADQLYQISAHDPLMFALPAALVLAIALLACWLPARRATRIDPINALRAD